jgi:hypothetical protein
MGARGEVKLWEIEKKNGLFTQITPNALLTDKDPLLAHTLFLAFSYLLPYLSI